MGALLIWLRENWFLLLQTLGIVGGLIFTSISIRQSTKARKASDLLTLTREHRELWNEIYSRQELARILRTDVDLVALPIKTDEEHFLNEVIVHFQMGWHLATKSSFLTLDAMRADVKNFFNLPIPRKVWQETKMSRDPKFVSFVEKCLCN